MLIFLLILYNTGLGISIFEYRYTEILKLFSVIFWIPKYWNSSQANFSILSKYRNSSKANFDIILKYRNSSQANFDIIPKYRNSSKANFSIIPKYRNSSQANFGFSEIGNAVSNHLLSAPTHIQILMYVQYNTLNEYALHLTAHSVLRIDFAIICQWLFSRLFPPSLRYITANAVHRWQAQSLTY